MIQNVYRSSCKEPLLVVITQLNFFLDVFSKNKVISNFMDIRQVGADFFREANGRTDVQTKIVVN